MPQGDELYWREEPLQRAEDNQRELKRLIQQIKDDQEQHLRNIRELNQIFHTHTGT